MARPFRRVRDHLIETFTDADPGLLRRHLALRGTVTVTLAALILSAAAALFTLPLTDFAIGVVFCLVGTFVLRDADPRNRRITLTALFTAAIVMVCAVAVVDSQPLFGDVFFLLLIFLACLLQAWHTRAPSVGFLSVVMTYVCLYLHLPVARLPLQLAALSVGALSIWLVSIVLFPVNAVDTLRRAVKTVLRRTQSVILATQYDPRVSHDLSERLAKLTDAALAAEDQLVLLDERSRTDVRLRLFEVESAVHRLLPLVSRPVLTGQDAAAPSATEGAQGRLGDAATAEIEDATHALSRATTALSSAAAAVAAQPQRPEKLAWMAGPLNWRNAIQVTTASLLAMFVGMLISPQRWFWAVIGVYVVFLNTRTRGDAIHRGTHRLVGTLVGWFGGVALAAATSRSGYAEIAVMLVSIYCMYYFAAVNYSVAIFFVTLLIGSVYTALGSQIEPLLALRLEESAVGIAAALLSACFVWPVLTRSRVRTSCEAVLEALRTVVNAAVDDTAAGAASPAVALRKLDRSIADFRLSIMPLQTGQSLLRRGRADRPLTAVLACSQAVRALVATKRESDASMLAIIRQEAHVINQRITSLLHADDRTAPPLRDEAPACAHPRVAALRALDLALVMLSERLDLRATLR